MKYNLAHYEQYYQVKLDSTQIEVLSNLLHFIESDKTAICLSACAGTGKSLLLSILYDILDSNGYRCAFITPTNKSKNVITQKGDISRTALTIHSLLGMRPNFNILEYDATQAFFAFLNYTPSNSSFDVLLVDECSMINDDLYKELITRMSKCKFIFSGDPKQLNPVKQESTSKIFSLPTLSLTTIYRQQESPIYDLLAQLRKTPIYHFTPIEHEQGNVIICNDIKELLETYGPLFKLINDFNDLQLIKMITYTNKRIEALNQYIRNIIYPQEVEYHVGELVTGYNSVRTNHTEIENSQDYLVTQANPTIFSLDGLVGKGWNLDLQFNTGIRCIKIWSRENSNEFFYTLVRKIEEARLRAIRTKNSKDWQLFYKLKDSILTPIDLYIDDRLVVKKSLDYGYCLSTHKSQSSGYNIVIIDMENLWRCPNPEELRQLQYVACSRTTKDLIIYQRNNEKDTNPAK